MAIVIKVVDEEDVEITYIGNFEYEDLRDLVQISTNMNMKCLNFIDPFGNTLFNEKQMYQVKGEIEILRSNKKINQELLTLIEHGADEALKDDHCYLKFEGD